MTTQVAERLTTLRLLVQVRRGIAMALRDTSEELAQDAAAVCAQARLAAARSAEVRSSSSRRRCGGA